MNLLPYQQHAEIFCKSHHRHLKHLPHYRGKRQEPQDIAQESPNFCHWYRKQIKRKKEQIIVCVKRLQKALVHLLTLLYMRLPNINL